MTPQNVVIVGAGQAGAQVAVSLRDEGYEGDVLLLGDETWIPYQRPPLSKGFLHENALPDSLSLRPSAYYAQKGIDLLTHHRAIAIDRQRRALILENQREIPYGHLVLATGARDRQFQIPGTDLNGVMRLRTLNDAMSLREQLSSVKDVVIIGAGFIGMELAATACKFGIKVSIIELAQRPLARASTPLVSQYFLEHHQSCGVEFLMSTSVEEIVGECGKVIGVVTDTGRRLAAQLVVLGIGVEPNVDLAVNSGLEVGNGIVVDEQLLTSDPNISAIGDCCNFPDSHTGARLRLESIQNANDQSRCVAARLAGRASPYRALPWFWSEQGALRLQIAGIINGHDATVVRGGISGGSFSVFCFKEERLIGVESINQPADHMVARRILANKSTISREQAADLDFNLKAFATEASRT